MSNRLNIPKQQHYISEFILNNFTDSSGKLFFTKSEEGQYKVIQNTPNKVFKERFLFSFKKEDVWDHSLEEKYSRIEGEAAPLVLKIIAQIECEIIPEVTPAEKAVLINLIDVHWTRSPDFHEIVFDRKNWQITIQNMMKEASINFNGPIAVSPMLTSYDEEPCKNLIQEIKVHSLRTRENARSYEFLQKMSLAFVTPKEPNKNFIIGSLPIVKITPFVAQLTDPTKAEMLFPISKKICLYLNNSGLNGVIPIERNFVRDINIQLRSHSSYVASHSEILLKSIIHNR